MDTTRNPDKLTRWSLAEVDQYGETFMHWEIGKHTVPLEPGSYHQLIPFRPSATSDRLGWTGLGAASFRKLPTMQLDRPALTHHTVILFNGLPNELDVRYEGVKRHRPPPIGAVSVVPAGMPSQWRWTGCKCSLHVYLEPGLVARVAAEQFGLDPGRWTLPPLDSLDLPQLRVALQAVDVELTAGGSGGRLAAESLAHILAVHLIRHVVAPHQTPRGRDGPLPRARLRAVLEYVEEHLEAGPTLEHLAAVARLSVYHFARQFRTATGLPPHQYVILRRVERAKDLLQTGTGLSLAEIAAQAGFSDQSQLIRHFKRLVGVTPGQFRTPARID